MPIWPAVSWLFNRERGRRKNILWYSNFFRVTEEKGEKKLKINRDLAGKCHPSRCRSFQTFFLLLMGALKRIVLHAWLDCLSVGEREKVNDDNAPFSLSLSLSLSLSRLEKT